MFKKFNETEHKYLEIENNTAKKLDELIQQIRNYLPINVNVNTNSQMINNNNLGSNLIPENNQIFNNELPINNANINIVKGLQGKNVNTLQMNTQSVNIPGQYNNNLNNLNNNMNFSNSSSNFNHINNNNINNINPLSYSSPSTNFNANSTPGSKKFQSTNNIMSYKSVLNHNTGASLNPITSNYGDNYNNNPNENKERTYSLNKKTSLGNIENNLNSTLPQVFLQDVRQIDNNKHVRLNRSKEFKTTKTYIIQSYFYSII